MADTILAYDLGTGGNKASLYDAEGRCLASVFVPYETEYPHAGWHEQRPVAWWNSVVRSTRRLLASEAADPEGVTCLAISGHSLGCVPLDAGGNVLREATPIWSDKRADVQAARFFERVDPTRWYRLTGNGFPPPHYTVFKIRWYRDNEPEMFRRVHAIVGTKDYINYRLTGRLATDYSYASGSGVYDLMAWDYADTLLEAAGLSRDILPAIVAPTEILGELTAEAAEALGLPRRVTVACGGVDNSCMALGARNIGEGRTYASLGSSSWIAVSSSRPLLDDDAKPYVFTHVIPGMFTSAVAIFSSGTSLKWVRDRLCANLVERARTEGRDPYDVMTELAATSPVGAKKLLFVPSLAGGSSLDASPNVRGAFLGLDLGHTQADVIRAALEGIALNLRLVLDVLRRLGDVGSEMVVVGGGSRSALWRRIFANALQIDIVKTNVGQEAASLGAAAVAAVACGLWNDFSRIETIHRLEDVAEPDANNVAVYRKLLPAFRQACLDQARLGDDLAALEP
ncbi:MAG: FGGY-family carbohydrate kinase [Phycisphaerales bacterium]|nr:MAG: FGGY-family carbohydrate kinase [Phycisphaerales bacterium]